MYGHVKITHIFNSKFAELQIKTKQVPPVFEILLTFESSINVTYSKKLTQMEKQFTQR